MKPIIFLDYDGVVNTIFWREYDGIFKAKYATSTDGFVNNFQAICWLNELFKLYPYDIVVTSTWRLNNHYADFLYNGGLNKEIKVIGRTPRLNTIRGEEIKQWMSSNNFEGKFVIVDDDSDMGDLKRYLVQCNPFTGFGIQEMYKVLEIFNC